MICAGENKVCQGATKLTSDQIVRLNHAAIKVAWDERAHEAGKFPVVAQSGSDGAVYFTQLTHADRGHQYIEVPHATISKIWAYACSDQPLPYEPGYQMPVANAQGAPTPESAARRAWTGLLRAIGWDSKPKGGTVETR